MSLKSIKSCYKSYTRSAKNNSEPSYEKGNFEAVCNVIEDEVIFKSKSFSIDALLNLYRENIDDLKQYIYYLKQRIECKFGEKIMFLSPGYREPDILVSKASTETSSLPQYFENTEDGMIVKTAELLRKRVLDTISTSSDMSWPPDVDGLKNRKPPEILEAFYRNLLGFNKQTEKSVRIVNSLCFDVLYNIFKWKIPYIKIHNNWSSFT